MPLFRKKPVIIEARKFDPADYDDAMEVVKWCKGEAVNDGILIKTLEGTHLASFGDYVIKGIKGEFYPCKPDIFEASYDLVENVGH